MFYENDNKTGLLYSTMEALYVGYVDPRLIPHLIGKKGRNIKQFYARFPFPLFIQFGNNGFYTVYTRDPWDTNVLSSIRRNFDYAINDCARAQYIKFARKFDLKERSSYDCCIQFQNDLDRKLHLFWSRLLTRKSRIVFTMFQKRMSRWIRFHDEGAKYPDMGTGSGHNSFMDRLYQADQLPKYELAMEHITENIPSSWSVVEILHEWLEGYSELTITGGGKKLYAFLVPVSADSCDQEIIQQIVNFHSESHSAYHCTDENCFHSFGDEVTFDIPNNKLYCVYPVSRNCEISYTQITQLAEIMLNGMVEEKESPEKYLVNSIQLWSFPNCIRKSMHDCWNDW